MAPTETDIQLIHDANRAWRSDSLKSRCMRDAYEDSERHEVRQSQGALGEVLRLLAARWAIQVLDVLSSSPRRYNDVLREMPGIAPKVLTDQLRRLESAGVICQREHARWHVYELTPDGRQLLEATVPLARWSQGQAGGTSEPSGQVAA